MNINSLENYWYNKYKSFNKTKKRSYGLIVFFEDGKELKVLLYQQRDTYGYNSFLRGIWDTDEQVINLLALTTEDERHRLLNNSFDSLWKDLWIDNKLNVYKDRYAIANFKFDSIKDRLNKIFSDNPVIIQQLYWGFPKGRLDDNETPKEAALREFYEETGIETDNDNIEIWNHGPYKEEWCGNDSRIYQTYYYIAFSKKQYTPKYLTQETGIRTTYISEESVDFKWFKIDDAYLLLEPRRRILLKKIVDFINC